MKIAIVTTWFERGAAYVSKQFYNTLSKEHNVLIYARGGEKYAKNNNKWDKDYVTWGKQVNFPIPTYIDINDFKKFLLKNNIEIVIFNEQWWWEPLILCNKLNIKTGAYIDYYTELTIPLFKNYDFLICNTKKHLQAFEWHKQVFYIPWGTDTELFKPNNLDIVDKNKITFFHSCGMSPDRKGTDQLLLSIEKLKGNFLVIIHTQIDLFEQLSPKLQKILLKYIEENKVKLIVKTISAPGAYFMGDVYVYPTRLEGIGLTICEAVSSGLPTIVPNNSPMNEFIKNNINGLLVEVDRLYSRADGYYWPKCEVNTDSLANCMQYYINNKKNILKYKTDAREYALRNLNWENNSLRLNSIIKNIKIIEKPFDIQKKALNFYNKRYPYISSFQAIYRVLFYIYRKIMSS